MTQAFEDTSIADAGLEALLNKGRRSGSVSAEDVLEAIPDAEVSAEKLSSVISQLSENGIPTNATLQALHQPSGNQWYWTGSDPKATALVLEFGDRLIPIIGGRHADGA